MTKMDLIRNLAEDFNFGELHIAPVEVVKTVPCTLIPMPTQVIFNPPALPPLCTGRTAIRQSCAATTMCSPRNLATPWPA